MTGSTGFITLEKSQNMIKSNLKIGGGGLILNKNVNMKKIK